MSADEMQDVAQQCLETMQAMAGMMGMHGQMDGMSEAATTRGMGSVMGVGGMGSMMDMAGWLGLVVIGLLLLAAVVALVIVLAKGRGTDGETTGAGPLDELDRRYARGEVDRDSYLQARGDLQEARG